MASAIAPNFSRSPSIGTCGTFQRACQANLAASQNTTPAPRNTAPSMNARPSCCVPGYAANATPGSTWPLWHVTRSGITGSAAKSDVGPNATGATASRTRSRRESRYAIAGDLRLRGGSARLRGELEHVAHGARGSRADDGTAGDRRIGLEQRDGLQFTIARENRIRPHKLHEIDRQAMAV